MPGHNEKEWETRRKRIDTRLRDCHPGWEIVRHKDSLDLSKLDRHAVTEFPTATGPADYALFVRGKLLGIIEAKKVAISPQNVLQQAKRYATGAVQGPGNWSGLRVPFLYSTNGQLIWFLDVRGDNPTSRQIGSFHSPEALDAMFKGDLPGACARLKATSIDSIPRLRDYQKRGIQAIENAIGEGRRELLVAKATGTGKTYMTVAQIYRLMEAKAARRVLFLVDRKALAAQAVREFAAFNTPQGNKFPQEYEVYSQRFRRGDFEDDKPFDSKVLPNEYLTDPNPTRAFVYVSTVQRMTINLFGFERAFPQFGGDAEAEDEAGRLEIPNNAFDLIIADECHRGYTAQETSTWRDVMMHFDAIKVGLTATPAAHTVALFGEPVFRYGVEQAIRDGYLVDYEPVTVRSNVKMNGVFVRTGEQVGKIDTETGEEVFDAVEDERDFAAGDIEKRITVLETNKKIIREVAKYARQHEAETGRFPKTLIFAANDLPHTSHADQLVRICREEFKQGDDFVQKITGSPSVDRPLQLIRQFRNRPNPKIVVTVDMLSTGVDIPALEFIVFLRPVRSRILWEQMLGRGTRRCDEINKSKFVVFDCFGGTLIQYFRDVSNFALETPARTPATIAEIIENINQNIDRQYHTNVLVKRLRRIEKDMSAEARDLFGKFIPEGDMGRFAEAIPNSIRRNFSTTIRLLQNADFQRLLVEYPRAKRTFWRLEQANDEVSSETLVRFGRFTGAEDYLQAFSRYVQANARKIQAFKVLLHRPKDWSPEVLEELRDILRQSEFDEKTLASAHRVAHRTLADIISMVRHAAQEEEPVLTAEERVSRTMERLRQGHRFTPDQDKWLGLIQTHLVENLSISPEDFDLQPAFQRVGGLGRARQIFSKNFPVLLTDINATIASYGVH